MAETRTYQGHTYTREAPGDPWVMVGPAQPGPATIGTPDPAAPYEAPQAAANLERTQTQTDFDAAKERRAALEWNATHNPDGTPKPAAGQLTAEMRGAAMNQYGTLANLAAGVNDLRDQYETNFKGTDPFEAIDTAEVFGIPVGKAFGDKGRVFNDRSGALTAFIATALGLTGQQFNTPAEQKLFIQSILPTANDSDGQIEAKLNTLEELIGTAHGRGRATLGYTDENDPLLADPKFKEFLNRTGGLGGAPPPAAAGGGATTQSIPLPPEMQAENEAWLSQNFTTATPQAYAQFRRGLDQKYGFQAPPDADLQTWFEGASKNVAGGGQVGTAIPPANEELSGFDKLRNDVVSHPAGSFAASMANAGGFGTLSLLAGDQMDAARELNPKSSFAGEMVGGITGTMGAGAGLKAVAGAVPLPSIARLLANPVMADMAYGATYGATQSDNPLLGAATGAGGAFLGSKVGGWIGRKAPILTGTRLPADPLGAGERRVVDAVGDIDPVVAALSQADELGVPASIADVSSGANSLTGAALRRSPAAAGDARVALGDRGRGQYDRLLGAVERDLGPIENIPQRSEDLIAQARQQAGPLYDSAYAAPGAENINLSDLAERPTFGAALREAYNEVLDEGLDPSAIGLQQIDDGVQIASPSWRSLDYVKRGLDNIIERNTSKIDGVTPEGRRAIAMKNLLLSRMDELNPDYAAARAAYSGPAAERAALRQGQEALSMSPNQLGVNLGRASPANADQMRLGFQSALGERAGGLRNSTNPFESTLGTPGMEQRLGTLYPDNGDSVARLLAQRDLEREMAGSTNRLIGNSMTAERGLADQAFGQNSLAGDMATGTIETLLTGAPVVTAARSGIGRSLGSAVRDWRTLGFGKRATALADEIAPITLEQNPDAAIERMLTMALTDHAYRDKVAEALLQAGRRGGHIGAAASAALQN